MYDITMYTPYKKRKMIGNLMRNKLEICKIQIRWVEKYSLIVITMNIRLIFV